MQTPLVYRCTTRAGPRRFPAILTVDAHGLKCVKVGYVIDKGQECHYPNGLYQIRYRLNGKQKFISLDKCDNHPHVLLVHADMARKGIQRLLAGKQTKRVSLEQKSRDYLIDLRKRGHKSAARSAEYVFEEFLPLVPLSVVTRQVVLNYHAWMRGDDSAMSQMLLGIMGSVAQFERAMIRERQLEGIAKAKAAGKYDGKGRPAKFDAAIAAVIRERVAAGENVSAVAREFNTSRPTIYRVLG